VSDPLPARGLQHQCRSGDVGLAVTGRIHQRGADAGAAGEVDDGVEWPLTEGPLDDSGASEITFHG